MTTSNPTTVTSTHALSDTAALGGTKAPACPVCGTLGHDVRHWHELAGQRVCQPCYLARSEPMASDAE